MQKKIIIIAVSTVIVAAIVGLVVYKIAFADKEEKQKGKNTVATNNGLATQTKRQETNEQVADKLTQGVASNVKTEDEPKKLERKDIEMLNKLNALLTQHFTNEASTMQIKDNILEKLHNNEDKIQIAQKICYLLRTDDQIDILHNHSALFVNDMQAMHYLLSELQQITQPSKIAFLQAIKKMIAIYSTKSLKPKESVKEKEFTTYKIETCIENEEPCGLEYKNDADAGNIIAVLQVIHAIKTYKSFVQKTKDTNMVLPALAAVLAEKEKNEVMLALQKKHTDTNPVFELTAANYNNLKAKLTKPLSESKDPRQIINFIKFANCIIKDVVSHIFVFSYSRERFEKSKVLIDQIRMRLLGRNTLLEAFAYQFDYGDTSGLDLANVTFNFLPKILQIEIKKSVDANDKDSETDNASFGVLFTPQFVLKEKYAKREYVFRAAFCLLPTTSKYSKTDAKNAYYVAIVLHDKTYYVCDKEKLTKLETDEEAQKLISLHAPVWFYEQNELYG